MVPAVRSCSGIIIYRFVMIVMQIPLARAVIMADKRGGDVKLGVRKVTERLAVERRCRSIVFSGVSGGVGGERSGRNEGRRWWGDGSKIAKQDGLADVLVGTANSIGTKSSRPQKEHQN